MIAVLLLSKTFSPPHYRAGEATRFSDKVRNEIGLTCKDCREVQKFDGDCCGFIPMQIGRKKHTCRKNYKYWKDTIDRLKQKGGVLSVRQWLGLPYKQPGQEVIVDIPAEIVGVQKLELTRRGNDWEAKIDGYNTPVALISTNDGLTEEEFKAWFAPLFEKEKAVTLDFAIIHFTKERY